MASPQICGVHCCFLTFDVLLSNFSCSLQLLVPVKNVPFRQFLRFYPLEGLKYGRKKKKKGNDMYDFPFAWLNPGTKQ